MIGLDHTIVWCRDQERSASFLAELLGRPAPHRVGPFLAVQLDNGVTLDFDEMGDAEFSRMHLAFRVSGDEFTRIYRLVHDRGMEHWADPMRTQEGAVYEHGGDRGFYFLDPDDHLLEVITAA